MSQRAHPYRHVTPGVVVFGPGTAQGLAGQRALRGAGRVLVVSDAGVRDAGLFERVRAGLGDKVALVDDRVVPDADAAHINALAETARAAGVDAVVAVGGGSVMDTAKAVAALLVKGGRIQDLEGMATVRASLPPLVCVPTTAGTGSESTAFVVVADREQQRKLIINDTSLVPALAVLDPELVVGLPEQQTAATGVDALSHAVEAIGSRMRNPFGSALAMEAARIICVEGALARSLAAPDDVDARGRMLTAACLAGQAISTSMLGACHAFAHALGAVMRLPHGLANGLFLVPVMRMNLPKARAAYAQLGVVLGGHGDEEALAQHAVVVVERVVHEVARVPTSLAAVGVTRAELPEIARLAMLDPDWAANPVQLTEPALIDEMLDARM